VDWRPSQASRVGTGTVRRISNELDVRAADATPRYGDFWILKIAHALSPKNVSKNGFCPRKGVAFLWKAFLQKNFRVREKIPLSALPFGRSHALVAEGFKEPSTVA
jgi:hypothetical protein